MKLSIVVPPEVRSLPVALDWIERAEQQGFHSAMLGCGEHLDPMIVYALAAERTERVLLTPNIIPTYTRHPLVMAMQAATTQAAVGGRLRLGLGPGHASVIEQGFGLHFDRLIRHTREYLSILGEVFRTGAAHHQGEMFQVDWTIDVEAPPVPLYLASLGEQMCRTAGRQADGVLPWLAPPAYVRDTIIPQLGVGASEQGRAVPEVVMIMPCIHSTDREQVRAGVHAYLDIYPRFEAYAALLQRCKVPDAEHALTQGWTDPMIDAVVPHGDQQRLSDCLDAYAEAGCAELAFLPVGVGDDPQASVARTWEVLAELAGERNAT